MTVKKRPSMTVDPKSTYHNAGGVHTIEVIRAKLTPEQYKGYLLGNIIKYTLRANFKDSFERDCEKVEVFSNWLDDANKE